MRETVGLSVKSASSEQGNSEWTSREVMAGKPTAARADQTWRHGQLILSRVEPNETNIRSVIVP